MEPRSWPATLGHLGPPFGTASRQTPRPGQTLGPGYRPSPWPHDPWPDTGSSIARHMPAEVKPFVGPDPTLQLQVDCLIQSKKSTRIYGLKSMSITSLYYCRSPVGHPKQQFSRSSPPTKCFLERTFQRKTYTLVTVITVLHSCTLPSLY